MSRNYSYFIIKPDGMRYLDKICNIIEQEYSNVRYFAIEDYENITKKLYYKHYEQKGEKFAKSFDSYLYGLKEIFGNYAILVLVSEKDKDYVELVKNVFRTKTRIRHKFTNKHIGIVTDYGDDEKNYLRFISEKGELQKPRIMQNLGNHRVSDTNIIHSPDPVISVTLKELQILSKEGIIDDRNMIMENMMNQMKKYHTANFQEDMRVEEYEGGVQPDISGFIINEINKNTENPMNNINVESKIEEGELSGASR